ncbi:MAG TPA: CopG family transcriptional regulator [Phycisphaerae bacterium]|nr:CopG family transcriptional regulator [Phycisphaerae bacterium]
MAAPAESTIQLDDALKRRIDELAESNGVSPADLVREAVDAFAARRNGSEAVGDSEGLWDDAAKITASVPAQEWEKLPGDLARNFDHYHYGHPRED